MGLLVRSRAIRARSIILVLLGVVLAALIGARLLGPTIFGLDPSRLRDGAIGAMMALLFGTMRRASHSGLHRAATACAGVGFLGHGVFHDRPALLYLGLAAAGLSVALSLFGTRHRVGAPPAKTPGGSDPHVACDSPQDPVA
jgi:hypothetical protein